ncbi:benzoylformate decarboxylase [Bradyrhizobium sp. GM2.2]|jgi:benzoylformate decarboxylase|uniref:benzoylformate decarboxylase n=1 Tax=unclassified Bradyrhizobium TaxID=2631580 RepID=UPI001FF8A2E1|nr:MULTISPECIES: benzoylformate decarboxylase [unclassified Bradyrhizobium]MCK1267685.1 benzoylformate decarboxylase [Bradyrhizobium sp. 84]MCK1290487.1 benzoylformate decarboxylase [Bradyrhizobium sp. 30]MCK1308702.1 benzoylformate decarboxylase [Bradyrhizobium sp. 45]MCK1312936.1 benzoylformate decarboxylase [Bradyrhizobium sp. 23]MCK1320533.1 benzoylformate decarboxylase [Bradyrhizobium sp. 156]
MVKNGKATTKSVTVKQATLDLLRSFGIKKVFGNPGSTELPFLSDWPDDIDYVLALQEASAVGMADGYAQATRNAGFVNLHSAAGVGNALGNIYTAHRNQTPLVITAGQQARSILPLQAFLYAERASEFPRPYVKYSVEPARPEDVPAAIARAYYTAMQPPCGPTFVSIPVDDWAHAAAPIEARKVSREIGPEADAMKALVTAFNSAKHPALVVGPGVDRAGAVDLMVRVAEKARASVWVSPFSARCSFPERHPQFAGFLHASPAQLSDALREHDLVVVIGAPVFTFHVEGHAAIFDGGATIFQITDDPDAAAVTPVGTSIIATMKPALAMLLDLLPESKRAAPKGRTLPPALLAGDPLPVEFLLHSLSQAMPDGASLVEEIPSHRPAMQKFMPMRGQDSFYTMASGGLGYSLPAAVGMALGKPTSRTVCLIGDGSAMYSIQALWTAAQRKLPLTIIVINNSGYGAMRSFSQVMQVRNVPGLELPGIDFVRLAEGMGCHAVRVSKAAELGEALKRGMAFEGTSLVEVVVDSAVPVLYGQKH